MSMIESLTPEQEKRLPEFAEEWFRASASTDPANRVEAEAAIADCYREIGEDPPSVIWADSPLNQQLVIHLLGAQSSLRSSLRSSLWSSLELSLWSSLESSLRSSLESSLESSLRSSLESSLWSSLQSSGLRINTPWSWVEGYWLAFYEFCGDIGASYDNEVKRNLALRARLDKACGWVCSFKGVTVACERPSEIHWSGPWSIENPPVLHRDGGPAVVFRDGWSAWCLNGRVVPRWLAETTAEKLDPAKFAALDNAEVRREFIAKVGIERVLRHCDAKSIDSESFTNETGEHPYELLEMRVDDDSWRYLRMTNPSLESVEHVEDVPSSCSTVREALNFRNSLTEDQIDDEFGSEWYQQGDVILRPKGATKFRRFPKVLT